MIATMILAGSLAASSAHSQVRVDARVGFGAPAPVVYERDYPGYAYYEYPAWRGHYQDRFYYEHYHRRFYRDHRGYFNGRRYFDHERFERERDGHRGDWHRGPDRRY